ncbi:MAG: CU044_2847 family protein [Acetobacteraceae bacterium]
MSPRMIVQLPDGNQIWFGDQPDAGGLREVARAAGPKTTSYEKFEAALGSLGTLVTAMEHAIGHMMRRPDKVTVELGASLNGDCRLWIASGHAGADFKITLTWDHPPAEPAPKTA